MTSSKMHPRTAYAIPRTANRETHERQFANPDSARMGAELQRLAKLSKRKFVKEMRENYPNDRTLLKRMYPSVYKMVSERGLREEVFPNAKPQGHAWRMRHPLGEEHWH